MSEVNETKIPDGSYIVGKKNNCHYCDSFQFRSLTSHEVINVYIGIFGTIPKWIISLMQLRNHIVKVLGFSAEDKIQMSPTKDEFRVGANAGFLTVEYISDCEVVTSVKDKHMDLWISVMKVNGTAYHVSSLVNLNSTKGKVYMKLVKPFHKLIARKAIEDAIKKHRV